MKLITWNVNGIRAVSTKGFHEFITAEKPDILCLQETKAHPEQLGPDLLKPNGMKAYWSSAQKKGYSGVATFCVLPSDSVTYGIGNPDYDLEGRVIVSEHNDIVLYNIYFPNGSASPERHLYKQNFLKDLNLHLQKRVALGEKIIVVGDYNVAYLDHDVHDSIKLSKVSGFLPEERQWFQSFLKLGFVDVFRFFNKDLKDQYTWWSYQDFGRSKNKGWRIDHICVTENLMASVKSVRILHEQHGSDHCPVEIVIEN